MAVSSVDRSLVGQYGLTHEGKAKAGAAAFGGEVRVPAASQGNAFGDGQILRVGALRHQDRVAVISRVDSSLDGGIVIRDLESVALRLGDRLSAHR